MSEIIPIVDKNDKVIEYRERKLTTKKDIYRVAALWLINSKNQILLSQRGMKKSHSPGKWGPATAGTVGMGETYLENIIKETKEEIGINLQEYNFKKVDKIFTDVEWKYFCQWYFLKADIPLEKFAFPKDEVEQLRWADRKEFEKDLQEHPENYTTSMAKRYEMFKKYF